MAIRISSTFPIKHSPHLQFHKPLLSLSTNPQKQFKVEISSSGRDDVVLDESAYEAERLSLDAEARQSMAEASERESKEEGDPKAWKWVIRKRVWDLMEALNIAQFPRPVHHRIPNFDGASLAANKVVKRHL